MQNKINNHLGIVIEQFILFINRERTVMISILMYWYRYWHSQWQWQYWQHLACWRQAKAWVPTQRHQALAESAKPINSEIGGSYGNAFMGLLQKRRMENNRFDVWLFYCKYLKKDSKTEDSIVLLRRAPTKSICGKLKFRKLWCSWFSRDWLCHRPWGILMCELGYIKLLEEIQEQFHTHLATYHFGTSWNLENGTCWKRGLLEILKDPSYKFLNILTMGLISVKKYENEIWSSWIEWFIN